MADLVSADVQDFQEWQFIHLVPDVSISQYQSLNGRRLTPFGNSRKLFARMLRYRRWEHSEKRKGMWKIWLFDSESLLLVSLRSPRMSYSIGVRRILWSTETDPPFNFIFDDIDHWFGNTDNIRMAQIDRQFWLNNVTDSLIPSQ